MKRPWPLGLAALACLAAVFPWLAVPMLFLTLLGVLAVPERAQPGSGKSRALVALAVIGSGVSLVRFVVEVAMPNIVGSGREAGEQRAVSWLRDVLFAEDAMRKAGWIDPDHDGIGSAALLSELCGGPPLRGQPEHDNPVLTCGELVPTPLGLAARRGGFLFVICLPQRDGQWSGEPGSGLDEEAAERQYVAYAWPDVGARFDHAFFLDQSENIQTARVPPGVALECGSARGLGARLAWAPWRGKRPRPGRLPGDFAAPPP